MTRRSATSQAIPRFATCCSRVATRSPCRRASSRICCAACEPSPTSRYLRIGSRVPVFLPQRITPELVDMLRQFHPLWLNIHFNHPKEITPEVEAALARLADAGIPLGNQSVLLAGVNDCPNVMKDLVQKLVRNRVRPYYIYQCDLVHGAGHFRTPVAAGIQIIESLRGHTSGFAVPTFVIDAPRGGGKIPIMPNYLLSQSTDRVVVRNFEGFITTYTQPETYQRHDPGTCPSCRSAPSTRARMDRRGWPRCSPAIEVAIVPEGFDTSHQRLTRIRWAPIKKALTPGESMMKVALLANLKKNAPTWPGVSPDRWDDLDSEETMQAIMQAIADWRTRVTFLEGDATLFETLPLVKPDICFNLCEGHFGDGREAQVPAILEMLRIPYTGSQVLTLALALDKPMTKRVLTYHGLPTPPFQVFERVTEPLDSEMDLSAVREAQPRRNRHGRQRRVDRARRGPVADPAPSPV